jgi:hypothetical protein
MLNSQLSETRPAIANVAALIPINEFFKYASSLLLNLLSFDRTPKPTQTVTFIYLRLE